MTQTTIRPAFWHYCLEQPHRGDTFLCVPNPCLLCNAVVRSSSFYAHRVNDIHTWQIVCSDCATKLGWEEQS